MRRQGRRSAGEFYSQGQSIERVRGLTDQFRPLIDERGIDLHQARPGADFVDGVSGAGNAADSDDGDLPAELGGEGANDFGATLGEGPARKTARLVRPRMAGHW